MNRSEVAAMIDHTLLAPEATAQDVARIVEEAARYHTYAVCVSPTMLPLTVPAGLHVATVIGFPSGAHSPAIKAAEAAEAVANGADEIDMVINLALAVTGDYEAVEAEIASVRAVVPGVLKVIIESAVLNDEQIVGVCRAAKNAGADYVKTSTGFHKAGGASVHAVRLMRETVGPEMGVKASGGIRDAQAALAMIEAGANRLGVSATVKILEGLPEAAE